jgi:maltooligosyltrehalose trehalohydrolase
MTALMLLTPGTPMLFQGQEFCASSPFLYFADHKPELAESIRKGRAAFLAQFPTLATPQMQARLADPGDIDTFERSKLDLSERERHRQAYDLHRDLLRLRREDAVFSAQRSDWMHGAVLCPTAFLLRFISEDDDDRLLFVNLGCDLHFNPAPEPLLAPPENARWEVLWSSEDSRYGGHGTPPLDIESDDNWRVPGHATVVLYPVPRNAAQDEVDHG